MRENSKNKGQKSVVGQAVKYLISIAVAGILLWFSFRGVKWDDFVESLKASKLGFIGVSMAAGILAFYLRGIRWRGLLLPIDPSISRLTAFNAYNIGYLANFVFPRIGEFVRCGVITGNSEEESSGATGDAAAAATTTMTAAEAATVQTPETPPPHRHKKASYDKVLGTVVLERAWDMVTMLILLIVLLAFKWADFGSFFIDKMWHPLQERLDFSLWWLILAGLLLAIAAIWLVIATKSRLSLSRKICDLCAGLLQGIGSCLKMKRKWLFFVHTVLIWLMYWIMCWATMHALPGLSLLTPADAMFLMLAGSFGWVVPVPGGFGAFHFIVSIALASVYGLDFDLGLVFATLSHESQAITMILCGALSYLYEFFLRRRR